MPLFTVRAASWPRQRAGIAGIGTSQHDRAGTIEFRPAGEGRVGRVGCSVVVVHVLPRVSVLLPVFTSRIEPVMSPAYEPPAIVKTVTTLLVLVSSMVPFESALRCVRRHDRGNRERAAVEVERSVGPDA